MTTTEQPHFFSKKAVPRSVDGKLVYNSLWLRKEISYRTGISQKDVAIVLRCLERVVHDIVAEGSTLLWYGLLKVWVSISHNAKGLSGKGGIPTNFGDMIVVRLSPSESLTVAARMGDEYFDDEKINVP